MAKHTGLSSTAERKQEQSVCPNYLVGLHSGQRPRSFHLQRFFPGLLHLVNNMQIGFDSSLISQIKCKKLLYGQTKPCSSRLPFPWRQSVSLSGIFPDIDHTPDTRCFLLCLHLHSFQPNHHRNGQCCCSPGLQHSGHNLPNKKYQEGMLKCTLIKPVLQKLYNVINLRPVFKILKIKPELLPG